MRELRRKRRPRGLRRCGPCRIVRDRRGPVAQLDRALPSEGRGRTFESCRVRQLFQLFIRGAPVDKNGGAHAVHTARAISPSHHAARHQPTLSTSAERHRPDARSITLILPTMFRILGWLPLTDGAAHSHGRRRRSLAPGCAACLAQRLRPCPTLYKPCEWTTPASGAYICPRS